MLLGMPINSLTFMYAIAILGIIETSSHHDSSYWFNGFLLMLTNYKHLYNLVLIGAKNICNALIYSRFAISDPKTHRKPRKG